MSPKMTSNTENFVFTSEMHDGRVKTTVEPSPAYTSLTTDTKHKPKEDKKPLSVFTIRHGPGGEMEFSSNKRIVRISVDHSYSARAGSELGDYVTNIKADIVPTNAEVIKQVEQDIHNAETKAVMYPDWLWADRRKKKQTTVVENKDKVVAEKKRGWWSFGKGRQT